MNWPGRRKMVASFGVAVLKTPETMQSTLTLKMTSAWVVEDFRKFSEDYPKFIGTFPIIFRRFLKITEGYRIFPSNPRKCFDVSFTRTTTLDKTYSKLFCLNFLIVCLCGLRAVSQFPLVLLKHASVRWPMKSETRGCEMINEEWNVNKCKIVRSTEFFYNKKGTLSVSLWWS